MKLYSANLSPFAAVPRMAIYAKALPVEISLPTGGLKSPEYLAVNPIGKIPCLEVENGFSVPESTVIVEYLEDAFPERSLRPADPRALARMRLITRVAEIYVMVPLRTLFGQTDPAKRDAATVEKALDEIEFGLDHLDRLVGDQGFAAGDRLTTADCQLVPALMFVRAMLPAFGRSDLLASRPRLTAYFDAVAHEPTAARILGEMKAAMERFRATGEIE